MLISIQCDDELILYNKYMLHTRRMMRKKKTHVVGM